MSIIKIPIGAKHNHIQSKKREAFTDVIVTSRNRLDSQSKDAVLARYYPGIKKAQQYLDAHKVGDSLFEPTRQLPILTDKLIHYLEVAQMHLTLMGEYKGRMLKLLNLMSDPSTHTTKSFASLIMVLRAIQHIQQTGENILILVTTSGNKGTALRSAVERAIVLGLVKNEQLRIAVIAPKDSAFKLQESLLSREHDLRRLNPIILYTGANSTAMKQIGQEFQEKYYEEFVRQQNTKIWYTLNLDNYQVPDSARAYYEYENLESESINFAPSVRLHAHAVSSAYGFLGYHLGRSVLVQEGLTSWEENPGYFLVQHLHTPDMVLHYYFNSFDRQHIPPYQYDEKSGLYLQNQHAHFPRKTLSVTENVDPTFYSLKPPTSPQVSDMIRQFGGGGIVISLWECMEKFPIVRALLGKAQIHITPDPRKITEWASLMALTGVLQAIEREIIPEQAEVTIHASGYYASGVNYSQLCEASLPEINDDKPLDNLKRIILGVA